MKKKKDSWKIGPITKKMIEEMGTKPRGRQYFLEKRMQKMSMACIEAFKRTMEDRSKNMSWGEQIFTNKNDNAEKNHN